jgi:hypothetical protein
MAEVVENWTRTMTDVFSKAGQGLNPFAAAAGKGGREGLAFWDLPFDNLARTLSAGMPVPGDFMKAVEAGRPTDLRAQVDRFLSAPAIGYARESQEQVQKFARLMLEYEKAMADFQAGFGDLGSRSMEAFRKRLEARATDNGAVNSVREIFNLWVDACEEVYADYALSDDHARRYGQMVNALMAVKQQGAQLVDEGLEAMNMPTAGRPGDAAAAPARHPLRLSAAARGSRGDADRTGGTERSAAIELETLRAELEQLRKDVKALAAAPAARADAAGDGGEAPAAAAPSKAAPKRTRAPDRQCPEARHHPEEDPVMSPIQIRPDEALNELTTFQTQAGSRYPEPDGRRRDHHRGHAEGSHLRRGQDGPVPLPGSGQRGAEPGSAADRVRAGQPALHGRPAGRPFHRARPAGGRHGRLPGRLGLPRPLRPLPDAGRLHQRLPRPLRRRDPQAAPPGRDQRAGHLPGWHLQPLLRGDAPGQGRQPGDHGDAGRFPDAGQHAVQVGAVPGRRH